MLNKYEQIVQEQFRPQKNNNPGLFKSVMDNLVAAFSDTGALGAFTDILTGDRAAKQYTADPIGQRIYQLYVQPAVVSAQKGDLKAAFDELNSGFEKLIFYVDSYKLNLRKYLNDPRVRDTIDKGEGYAWYPEQVIGMPTSRTFSRLRSLGKSGYQTFPQAYEIEDSIKQGVGAIISGAQIIIGMRFEDIISNQELREQVYLGVGRILSNIENMSSIAFSIRTSFRTYSSFDAEFDLGDLVDSVNKDNQNVIRDLIEFMKLLKGTATAMKKINQNNSNSTTNNASIDLNQVTSEVLKRIIEMANGENIQLILTEEDLEEQSVVANIAGYSLPLGASNQEDPDKEMNDEIKGKKSDSAYKWDNLDVSTSNIANDEKDSFEKGSDFIFKGRKPRS